MIRQYTASRLPLDFNFKTKLKFNNIFIPKFVCFLLFPFTGIRTLSTDQGHTWSFVSKRITYLDSIKKKGGRTARDSTVTTEVTADILALRKGIYLQGDRR